MNYSIKLLSCCTAILFFSSSDSLDTDYISITQQANTITSDLTSISETGMRCDYRLKVLGIEGSTTKECSNYINAVKNHFIPEIGPQCIALSNWYEKKRKYIVANPNLAEKDATQAKQILIAMKAIQKACTVENYESSYPYLMAPMNHINSLSKIEQ